MNDEALSPVIAVMLILAVAVTIFSVYNAEYMPGLKQQAEVEHFQKVEESMARFGSALENAASLKRTLSMSEPVVLGGGDILLHSARSAGTIRVQQEAEPVITIIIKNSTGDLPPIPLYLVNFSYWTLDNFWVEQGYSWQYGFVNVSWVSGDKWLRSVPLQYSTMERVEKEKFQNSTMGRTLIDIQCTSDDCNNFTLYAVNMETGPKNFTSGNGVARFELIAKEDEIQFEEVKNLNFFVGNTPFKDIQNWDQVQNKTLENGNITLKMIHVMVSTS